jgi:peptide deformylase
MTYEIVKYPAAVLMRPARRIGAADGHDLHQLFADMVETMNANHGVGLAAPQVGLGLRFIVAHSIAGKQDYGLANPQIIAVGQGTEIHSEGCLSFPEVYGDVERALSVTVRYQDLDWNLMEIEAEGHFARVLQHEIDHLNGVLLIDRAVDGLYTLEEGVEGEEDEADAEGENAAEDENSQEADGSPEPVASMPPEAS